jgi:hypothetical protein
MATILAQHDRDRYLRGPSSADCARPERLLDPHFVEIGASGRRWSRQEMIAELLESSRFGEVDI